MYIADLTHFLDKSGAIGPVKGPARVMAPYAYESLLRVALGDWLSFAAVIGYLLLRFMAEFNERKQSV